MLPMRRPKSQTRSGFTLAEAAVTIAIVALTLSATMQSLEVSKLKAAHTQNQKTAKELGLMTLGAIESGKWWDEIETGRTGSYADNDYPDFYWEIALGDETFIEIEDNEEGSSFDNWQHRRDLQLEAEYNDRSENPDDEEDEEATEPYEQVRVRVTFPKLREYDNEVILERWIAWEQVYGEEEDEEGAEGEDAGGANGGGGGSAPGGGGMGAGDLGGGR
ncbi:MAG: type II secretion system protein [bacterium]|nr:type II secretion system protein [bacterium]